MHQICKWCMQRLPFRPYARVKRTFCVQLVRETNTYCCTPTQGTLRNTPQKLPFIDMLLKTGTINLQIHLKRQSQAHPSLPGSGEAKHLESSVCRVINYHSEGGGKEVIVTQHGFQCRHKRGKGTKYSWQEENECIWRKCAHTTD